MSHRRAWISALIVTLIAVGAVGRAAEPGVVPEFRPLGDGSTLRGWTAENAATFWRFENGVLIGESDEALTGSVLRTVETFGDFVFEFDVRWMGEIDSGVMFREPELQLQLGVSRSRQRDLSGSFYTGGKVGYPEEGLGREVEKHFRPGEWNTFRLEARGTEFTVHLNGHPVSRYTDVKYAGAAPLGLQVHAKLKMRVEYRNLRVARLAP